MRLHLAPDLHADDINRQYQEIRAVTASGPNSIALLSAQEIASAVHRRTLSAVKVFEATVERIERHNGQLNAIVRFDPEVGRSQAREADARATAGEKLPLLGVPFTVKDSLWVRGSLATQGSKLFENFIAPQDSLAVARLRSAGAVYIGATNCPEFAAKGVTENLLYGVTRNPWRTQDGKCCTTGGSSGGSASAVAAGFGSFSLGTDAGGSIRRPAAHCGIVGFKPSHGLVPDPHGFTDASMGLSVVGPMARTAGDIALILRCIMGYDARDPQSILLPEHMTALDVMRLPSTGLRIAFSRDLGCGFSCDPDVMCAVESAVAMLRQRGFQVESTDPHWPAITATYEELACEEAGLASLYGDAWRAGSPKMDVTIGQLIDTGIRRSGVEIAQAMLRRRPIHESLARFFDEVDLLICPTAPVTAWPLDENLPQTIGGKPAGFRGHAAFTPLFNICGVPACSVPVGFVRGLPVGLQIIGPRFSDERVLQMARFIEQLLPQPSCPLASPDIFIDKTDRRDEI
jgi:aspartyl-tRNA(Asn)/glutamyl-tRNA(Gln) amidotransferase subunit A